MLSAETMVMLWSMLPVGMSGPPRAILMTEDCTELVPPLASWNTRESLSQPWLGSMEELVLVAWVWESWSFPHLGKARKHSYRKVGDLTNSVITQVQIQGFELVHPNIQELLEHVNGQVPQNQICRISMTQSNNGLSKRSPVRT